MTVIDIASSSSHKALSNNTLVDYLSTLDHIRQLMVDPIETWQVNEVAGGNLNLVFIVSSASTKLIVKQAVPFLRLVGDSWPLPLKRSYFENLALQTEAKYVPEHVPKVYHADRERALIIMQFCEPHLLARQGFIQGLRYPQFANHMSTFLAETLFKTSDLYLCAKEKKSMVAVFCDNTELCKITEDLVFTHPYMKHEYNRWTSPELDDIAKNFRHDGVLKIAAQTLKEKFLTTAQALIHGDLHTGSIMLTDRDTKVIDPEFAFFGPMGFDIGALLGNLLLAYFSQPGHATEDNDRQLYGDWLLTQVESVWKQFCIKFTALWSKQGQGDCYTKSLLEDDNGRIQLRIHQRRYLRQLFSDTVGFAAVKMIRRILGLAHVEDFESIQDQTVRATLERKALICAREMLVYTDSIHNVHELVALAKELAHDS